MVMTIAMNCRRIRIRIRFCERVGLPPRIMFVRPISNTAATEATDIGTKNLAQESDHGRLDLAAMSLATVWAEMGS
jgi:hypothetical protein